jgi:hypothetical protein
MKLNESLHSGDLRDLVKKVFEIDNFKSKIGNDEDIVVLSFTVEYEDPAKDLENFIEMGYNFVLDADVTPGEMDDGKYRVYVELERSRKSGEHIFELIEGIQELTGIEEMRFRYFKNFRSEPATLENLVAAIPKDKNAYEVATEEQNLNNFSEFFKRSYADKIQVVDESITFKRIYSEPLVFDIITSGSKDEVYGSVKGPIMLESKSMAEVMFLTKIIGNYNINKIGDNFIFENSGWAVVLKRKA